MNSPIEDPALPLIGANKKMLPPVYSSTSLPSPTPTTTTRRTPHHFTADAAKRKACIRSSSICSNSSSSNSRPFVKVGTRLAQRRELFLKRMRLCDLSVALAVLGILVMMLETELAAHDVITRSQVTSLALKLVVTVSTVGCLASIALYHVMDVQLFTINNSMGDWRLAITGRRVALLLLETLVCLIHPLPGEFWISWTTTDSDGHLSAQAVPVPLDVVLSLPMFLRLYLVLRCLMLHSRLYQDASSQSLGALNRINFNFSFLFKSMMALYPDYALSVLMLSFFLIASWTLRLCEMYNDAAHARVHGNFLNSMWVVAITFLTVGYGDIVPNSLCGRGVAVVSGMMGAGCTALVVAVLARKLELSSAEKYVHDFVLEIDMDKRLRTQAANVVKQGWRLYRLNRRLGLTCGEVVDSGGNKGEALSKAEARQLLKVQSDLLRAIYVIREIKAAQRRLADNALSMLDVHTAQRQAGAQLTAVRVRQQALDDKVSRLEDKLQLVYDTLCSMAAQHRTSTRPE